MEARIPRREGVVATILRNQRNGRTRMALVLAVRSGVDYYVRILRQIRLD
jgi:hypothetical protein